MLQSPVLGVAMNTVLGNMDNPAGLDNGGFCAATGTEPTWSGLLEKRMDCEDLLSTECRQLFLVLLWKGIGAYWNK